MLDTFLCELTKNIFMGRISIFGFDIGTFIIKAVKKKILIKGGGHKMAGGFSIKEDKIIVTPHPKT